jgi:hypothetical protein
MPAKMVIPSLPSDPKVREAIGNVSVRHGQLDDALKMVIKTLMDLTPDEARKAMARVGSARLRLRVKRLAKKRLGDDAPFLKLEAILHDAKDATEKRNELLHGLWASELDGEDVYSPTPGKFGPAPPAEELEALADTLHQITKRLHFERLDGFIKAALDEQKPKQKGQHDH